MLKVLLLGCLALYVASPPVGNDDDATGPNICNHCAPSVPSISENKLVKLVVTDFRSKPGDCIREHQEALCDSQYQGVRLLGQDPVERGRSNDGHPFAHLLSGAAYRSWLGADRHEPGRS